ncbi:hypothetical protein BGP34_07675 [Bacillus mycoides]|nr:hypothetical protein BGP34_07675 [Bacillus mycoides]
MFLHDICIMWAKGTPMEFILVLKKSGFQNFTKLFITFCNNRDILTVLQPVPFVEITNYLYDEITLTM